MKLNVLETKCLISLGECREWIELGKKTCVEEMKLKGSRVDQVEWIREY